MATVARTIPLPIPSGDATTRPCPCGRARALAQCCLPVAHELRGARRQRPSPFDEVRAGSALLLWSLLAREAPSEAVGGALSVAARRFWGPVLAAALDGGSRAPLLGAPTTEDDYGARLFERLWAGSGAETYSWLLGSVPGFVRCDALLNELALDWLLWDEPWLRSRAAAHWTARTRAISDHRRVRTTYAAILRSRVSVYRLDDVVPGAGFRLVDRLTGGRSFLHTSSEPWPDADERLLFARIYRFGRWQLLGGRCLLLDPSAVDELLTALQSRRAATSAPAPTDPRWRGWLKSTLIPLVAGQWVGSRLVLPSPDRYHGADC